MTLESTHLSSPVMWRPHLLQLTDMVFVVRDVVERRMIFSVFCAHAQIFAFPLPAFYSTGKLEVRCESFFDPVYTSSPVLWLGVCVF